MATTAHPNPTVHAVAALVPAGRLVLVSGADVIVVLGFLVVLSVLVVLGVLVVKNSGLKGRDSNMTLRISPVSSCTRKWQWKTNLPANV